MKSGYFLHKLHIHGKKRLALVWVNLGLVLLFLALLLCYRHVAGLLLHEQSATRWQGESEDRYAQVSAYLPIDSSLSPDEIASFRDTVGEQLLAASLEAEEGKSLYVDAYSAQGELTLNSDRGTATVIAIGISGDYFFFHPLYLRAGSYLSPRDLMQDRIVLDEETAWKLFGSFDVAGQEVYINQVPYLVAGVVAHHHNFATEKAEKAEEGTAFIFVDYSLIQGQSGITCYEVAMPDPISGFAENIVTQYFSLNGAKVVENSSRYGLEAIAKQLGAYTERVMVSDGIAYPTWENAARYTEAVLSLLLLAMGLLLVFPLVTAVRVLIYFCRKLRKRIDAKLEEHRIHA